MGFIEQPSFASAAVGWRRPANPCHNLDVRPLLDDVVLLTPVIT